MQAIVVRREGDIERLEIAEAPENLVERGISYKRYTIRRTSHSGTESSAPLYVTEPPTVFQVGHAAVLLWGANAAGVVTALDQSGSRVLPGSAS